MKNNPVEEEMAENRLLSMAEVASMCGVAEGTVASWRYRRIGPPAVRLPGAVRYHLADVVAWLDELETR